MRSFLPIPPAQPQSVAHPHRVVNKKTPQAPARFEPTPPKPDSSDFPSCGEPVGCFQESVGGRHAVKKFPIVFGFRAIPDPVRSPWNVIVVMVLVHQGSSFGQVEDGNFVFACGFNQPVIEPASSDGKLRNAWI